MFEQIVDEAHDVVVVAELPEGQPGFQIIYVNDAFCRTFGYAKKEVLGKSPRMLHGPDTCAGTVKEISTVIHRGGSIRRRILNYTKAGRPVWVEANIVPLATSEGAPPRFAAIERDVTEEVGREHDLEGLAYSDPLTRLANRRHYEHVLHQELSRAARTRAPLSLTILDIDHFKAVNDAWGHPVGDEVLVAVSEAIRGALRAYDHAARVGGEEFAIILPGADRRVTRLVIERVRTHIASRSVRAGAQTIRVTCSGGLAWAEPDDTPASLNSRADRALYLAKNGGRNQVREIDAGEREVLQRLRA